MSRVSADVVARDVSVVATWLDEMSLVDTLPFTPGIPDAQRARYRGVLGGPVWRMDRAPARLDELSGAQRRCPPALKCRLHITDPQNAVVHSIAGVAESVPDVINWMFALSKRPRREICFGLRTCRRSRARHVQFADLLRSRAVNKKSVVACRCLTCKAVWHILADKEPSAA